MSNYSKISLSQIDANAVADYVVASKKLVYRTDVAGATAEDVDKVSGVNAANIAVAVSIDDRSTVQNALKLGGLPAADYMTNTQGAGLSSRQNMLRELYGRELQNVMDELYTLRQELAKGGLIEDRGEYTGYIDTFRTAHPKHMNGVLAEAMPTDGERKDELFIEDEAALKSLDVYDYVVIVAQITTDLQKPEIRQIKEINHENKVITFNAPLSDDVYASPIILYWSRGINDEGMFKFAKAAEHVPSSDENHTGLSDDTFRIMRHTITPETGFAYSFRIPKEKQGFVTSFEICARAYGSPGAMRCYLIDDRDKDRFKNAVQAYDEYQTALEERTDDFYFFAESLPLTLSSAYGRRYVKFDFLQEDNTYPLMPQDEDSTVRYIAIIECLDCDKDNYYDIQFLQHKNEDGNLGDLELNNITYTYARQADTSRHSALSTNEEINASDMYYHITTRSVIDKEVYPEKEGLYTFHVQTKDPVNKARVMLRIRKEGSYVANTEDDNPRVYIGETLKINNTDSENGIRSITELYLDSEIYNPLELRSTEADISRKVPVVIGNNITEIAGRNETSITLSKPALVNDGDAVYRMAYKVSLKARKLTFENGRYNDSVPYKHFVLPLKEIFKDYRTYDKTLSGRILFETDLFGENHEEFNDFIIQIFWSNWDISEYTDIRRSQMGAIKDIAVSFNNSFE